MRKQRRQHVRRLAAVLLALVCALALPVSTNQLSAYAAGARGGASGSASQADIAKDSIGGIRVGAPASYTVTITTQPTSKTVIVGAEVKFTVAATGTGTLKYQWQYQAPGKTTWDNSTQTGAKTATLTVTTNANHHGYKYRCMITDNSGSKPSNAATLKIKPKITKQPANKTVEVGDTAEFTVTATGKATLKYQWQYQAPGSTTWTNSTQTGAKTTKLSVTTNVNHNGYRYRCVVTDGNKQTNNSNYATLTVKPKITTQPNNKCVSFGTTVTFVVAATGKATLKYQWQYLAPGTLTWKDSTQTGAKTTSLTVVTNKNHQGYQYRCIVTDGNGKQTTSKAVTLTFYNVPINSSTFPDAYFRERISEAYDDDGDMKLSLAEIKAVTQINVEEEDACSLKGVEFFTELRYLNCGYDSIGSLNVSVNKKLEQLECYSCGLKSLNMIGCTKLTDLECYWNNLTSLDLSTNTALGFVDCSGNKLTKLDLSKLTKLYQLACVDNDITTLDLSKNTEMEELVCDEGVTIIGGAHVVIEHDWWN